MKVYLTILFIVSISITADYFLKLASQRSAPYLSLEFGLGTLLYAGTAAGWVFAMKHMTLASIGVVYSVMTILFLAALGVLVFRESLGPRDLLGMAFAIAALALVGRST